MNILLAWFALLSVAFASCGAALGQGAEPFAERSLTSPSLQKALGRPRGSGAWDLNSLTAAALCWHSDLELARAQLATAEAGFVTAGSRPNPSLALVPQFTTPLRTYQRGTYSSNLDIPIETAGKRALRLDQAGQVVEGSRASLDYQVWQIRARLRLSLLALFVAEQRGHLLATSVQHQKEAAEMQRRRVEAGESSQPDLLQTRLLFSQTEVAAADAAKLEAEARAGVADAVEMPLASLAGVTLRVAHFAKLPSLSEVAALSRSALARRSDLAAARAAREAALVAVRGEMAKRFPDLHLLPGYSYDDTQNKVEFGFSFELPIFNQNRGMIAEAQGRVREAVARWHAAEARAAGEIALATTSFTAARAKLQMTERLLEDQQKGVETAQRLFEAGEHDRLSVSTAEIERDTAATLRLDALADAQRALGAWEVAVQATTDGWHPPRPTATPVPSPKTPRR